MKKNRRVVCQSSIAALLLGAGFLPQLSRAATLNWDGEAADSLWGSATNWAPNGLPSGVAPGDDLIFGLGGAATIDLGADRIANSLSFTLSGFQLGLAATTNILSVTTGNIAVSTTPAQINASINGANGLTKSGAGSLVLGGTAANIYTGLTDVTEGVLTFSKSAGVNAIGGDLRVSGTGSTVFTAADQLPDTANVTVTGTGAFSLTDQNETFANLNVTGGSATSGTVGGNTIVQSGTLTVNGGAFTVGPGTLWTANKVALKNDIALLGNGTRQSQLIVGPGGLEMTGAVITVNGGTTIGSKVTLNGDVSILQSDLTSSFVLGSGTGRQTDLTGGVRTFNVADGAQTNDFFTDTGFVGAAGSGIIKTGAGQWTQGTTGAWAFTAAGGTAITVREGVLQLAVAGSGNSFTGDIVIDGTGILTYTGQGNADPTVLGGGIKTILLTNGGTVRPLTSSDPNAVVTTLKTFSIGAGGGTIETPSGVQLILNDANQFSGTGTLTKIGPGQLILGQASTGYAAARNGNYIINEGAIYVGNANGLGASTGTVTVNASGAIGSNTGITIANSITVAQAGSPSGPGQIVAQGANTLLGGTLTLNADTVFNTADYNGGGATSATNRIIFTSGVVTGSGNLILNGPTGATRGILTMNNVADDFTGSITLNRGTSLENLARFNGAALTPVSSGKTISSAKIIFGAAGASATQPLLDLRDNGDGSLNQVFAYGNELDATANGGSINVSNGTLAGNKALGGKFQLGKLTIGAQTLTTSGSSNFSIEFTGVTTLTGDATISPASSGAASTSDLTLSGGVTGAFSLTKGGTGILVLPGSNTFGGAGKAVTISGGILSVGSTAALGDAQNTLTIGGGSLRATSTLALNRAVTITGTPSQAAGATTLAANGSIDVVSGATVTLSSPIVSTNSAVFGKTGTGTLVSTVTTGNPFGTGNIRLDSGTLLIQPSGTGANVSLTGANSGTVSRITTTAGTGYSGAPSALFSGTGVVGGIDATGTPTVTGTAPAQTVNGFTITNGGSGYTSIPTITLNGTNTTPATATVAAMNQFAYDKAAVLRLDKGANTSVTFTVGMASISPTNSVLHRSAVGATLAVVPTTLANLGVSERFIVNGGVSTTNGIVSPSIVGLLSSATTNATFLNYDAVNGFVPATLTAQSVADINFAGSTTNFDADANADLSFSLSLNALRVGSGVTVSGAAGSVLTLTNVTNPSFTGSQAGIILNGGSITVPTITPSNNPETMIYTSAANGTISSTITGTGSTTKFGPGTLTFSGRSLPTGAVNITEGTFAAGGINVINGQAVQLNTAGAVLDLRGFNQTVGNLTVGTPAGLYPLVTTTGGAATLNYNPTAASTFAGLLADGTGGGVLRLVKGGTQTATVTTINTYSGGTVVTNGILAVGNGGQLGSGNILISGPGKLQIENQGFIAGNASVSFLANQLGFSNPALILRSAYMPNIVAGSTGIIALDGATTTYNLPNILAGTDNYLGLNGATAITFNGGTLNVGNGSTYRLGGGGGTVALTFSVANVLTGANAVVVGVPQNLGGAVATNGSGLVSLSAAQNYSGATTVNSGSTLTLIGVNATGGTGGSALNSPSYDVNYGTLVLNSDVGTNIALGRNGNRLSDTAPVNLTQGTLRFTVANVTAAGGTTSETIGQLNFTKGSTIAFTRGAGAEVGQLTISSLGSRSPGSTLVFTTQAVNELGGTTAPNAKVFVTNGGPTLTNGIVAPYIVNQTDSSFVTYGVNGFANAAFTSANLETSTVNDVVEQSTAVALTADRSAYAVRLGTGPLTGNSVTIGSGGLILNNAATAVAHTSNLVFGSTGAPGEALLFSNNTAQVSLSGLLTASAITKFGGGSVRLVNTGNSTNAGLANATITVNAGTLDIGERGSTTASNPQTNDANGAPSSVKVVVNGGILNFFQQQTISGLSGTGGSIRVGANTSANTAKTLTVNTQEVQTFGGSFTSDDADATGADASLVKGGIGQLTMSGSVVLGRLTQVNYGELVYTGNVSIGAGVTDRQKLIIQQGGTFSIDNRPANHNDRITLNSGTATGGGYFVLSGGTFNYFGNSSAPSTETFGTATALAMNNEPAFNAGSDVINVVAGTGQSAILTSERVINRNAGASVVIRGTNLGGTRGAADVATFAYNTSSPALIGNGGALGTTGVGIIRGVIADSVVNGSDVFGLATYDTGTNGIVGGFDDLGVRRLTSAEQVNTIASGTTDLVNVRASSAINGIDIDTTINALHIGSGGSISGLGTLTINSGMILAADNGVSGTNAINVSALSFTGGEAIIHAASNLNIGSAINGFVAFTKGGSGTLTLSGTNSFFGAVLVNGGLLSVDSSARLGDFANNLTLNNGGGLQASGTFSLDTRNVALGAGGGRVDVTAGNSLTVAGVISGGLGTITAGVSGSTGARPESATVFTKTGAGTLVLTGVDTFTGRVEVNEGTLQVGDSSGVGSLSANAFVAVNNGGKLAGSGTINAGLTVNAGGLLQPGTNPGRLNAGATTFNGGALGIDILGPNPITDYSQLNVTGIVTLLSDVDLVLTLAAGGFNPVDDGSMTFTLIDNDGSDLIAGPGRFRVGGNLLQEGNAFISNNQAWTISYQGNTGNDVVITAIPEPASAVAMLAGAAGLLATRRFRRRS